MSGRSVIEGVACWAARLPGWEIARAVFTGERPAPEPVPRPAPALLAPTERRRAPDTVAIALEVASRACENAGRDPATLPCVFASAEGDLAISDYMCATLASDPRTISPIKFHNSVHNAAVGYWTIGTGCRESSTSVSARQYTFAAGLLEALSSVACEGRPHLYVAFDIDARGPMATVVESRASFGAGLVLGPEEAAGRSLSWRVDGPRAATAVPPPLAALLARNPLTDALALLEAIARPAVTEVVLPLARTRTLVIALEAV